MIESSRAGRVVQKPNEEIEEALAELAGSVETLRSWGFEEEVAELRLFLQRADDPSQDMLSRLGDAIEGCRKRVLVVPEEVDDAFRRALVVIRRKTGEKKG